MNSTAAERELDRTAARIIAYGSAALAVENIRRFIVGDLPAPVLVELPEHVPDDAKPVLDQVFRTLVRTLETPVARENFVGMSVVEAAGRLGIDYESIRTLKQQSKEQPNE